MAPQPAQAVPRIPFDRVELILEFTIQGIDGTVADVGFRDVDLRYRGSSAFIADDCAKRGDEIVPAMIGR